MNSADLVREEKIKEIEEKRRKALEALNHEDRASTMPVRVLVALNKARIKKWSIS